MSNIVSYVTKPEETLTKNGGVGASSYIPTYGSIASAFDAYRVLDIKEIKNKPESWSMLDVDSIAALGRVIDGPILGKEDLIQAEQALRGILFHESTQVLVPSIKVDRGDSISYMRLDKGLRNSASYEAINVIDNKDLLFTTEYLTINSDIIHKSSNPRSSVIGKPIHSLQSGYDVSVRQTTHFNILQNP